MYVKKPLRYTANHYFIVTLGRKTKRLVESSPPAFKGESPQNRQQNLMYLLYEKNLIH